MAKAAIACAPPTLNTLSTPAILAADRISGLITPPGAGVTIMISLTPAAFAGMAFIKTVE